MTQEEKIKEAKILYETANADQKYVLERLFPEFKESEDERIRNFLHHTFTAEYLSEDKLSKWHGEPVANILAWIEKQGEQNHIWSEEDERIYKGLYNLIYSTQYCDSRKELSDFLNSLKDRCTWKPNSEQLDALHDAAIYVDKSMFPYPKGTLMKLYKQLAKLREELL